MTTTASKPTLLSSVVPLYIPTSVSPPAKQHASLLSHHSYLDTQFDNQPTLITTTNQTPYYTGQEPGGNQSSDTMMSQVPAHHYDHHLNQQSNHHRHVSNASSISSLSSGHHSYDTQNYSSSNGNHDPFAVSASYPGSVSAGTAFGGVPVSAESFHQYPSNSNPQQHQRASSTSSVSSPFTEPTSVSEGDSPEGMGGSHAGVPGGRKVSQAQLLRRARTQASPYAIRTDHLSWSGDGSGGQSATSSNSGMMRSSSIASDTPSHNEDDLAEILRTHSRETSVSDWGGNTSQHGQSHHQTGIGAAGAFMDPYAAVANVHGHGGAFGATIVNMGGNSGLGGMVAGGMVGVGGGMVNTALVGGMGAQMGRMTLDNSETYEALSHHIRTAVTTSASDRARQAFVQAWLNSSYISYTDGNVSRQGLYGSYLRICQQYDIKPINSASFGKAVRQCFPNIKTRRLGVRGNSKYHYCGIRPATAKEAEILMNLSRNEQPEPVHGSQTPSSAEDDMDSECGSTHRMSLPPTGMLSIDQDHSQPQTPRTARPNLVTLTRLDTMTNLRSAAGLDDSTSDSNGTDAGRAIPFPNLEENLTQPSAAGLDHRQARDFWSLYLEHSRGLLDSVKSYRFDQFELNLRTFWAGLDVQSREVVAHPVMMSLVYRADAVVYDEILDYLQSQTLSPMPQQAFSSLRQLAQSMEQVIIVALESYSGSFVGPKIELAARFGHLIVRHLGICQLAQALSGIFSNSQSLKDMAEAWDGIDFEAVRNQAALVTNCQHDILGHCFDDFRQVISNPNSTIEHFIQFVECTYERCLQPSLDGERSLSPRSLLVRWCFVSSQLIRDLTLRSAASFGSFQIVNLFFDEWLGFKVLRKVALHVAAVAASVDATSADCVPAQSMQSQQQPNQMTLEQQPQISEGATPTSLTINPQHSNTTPVAPTSGSDGFMFSPNTTQAFVIAQQQASGASGTSPNVPTASGRSSFPSGLSPNVSDSRSPNSQKCPPLTSPPALSVTKPHSPENPVGIDQAVEFGDQAFTELMDVRAFVTSSAQNQSDQSTTSFGPASNSLSSSPHSPGA
ncbi:hypothetical protein CROQUDRAFT_700798 [Cronartium quercuum f. sp. fusiforme G11]|uniref:RFX-type winged-helix domain-containing protein n=1 Tax=Cronartium quercuum f. sp. fusiforme G11 TaxID=708437 RepID=A0A9P6TC02_9BASI|nr:hypothetical protein CROQUDRAFT_700798 [Cronartium quercuum f. sp. fusiforme G11]